MHRKDQVQDLIVVDVVPQTVAAHDQHIARQQLHR